eukprot:TRINITY_DN4977_c0_g1_i1.p1 TRINITY_DN4977_c0_g1~~TRINITY_DN4977_c0_g1_i1.p1  ORF type:complete len:637 (+),score=299.86 TRINITY_DN4977_c0_g1_i1:43-1953(+)
MFDVAASQRESGSTSTQSGVGEMQLDPEQVEKYNEIIDLLLAGGYFRARIQGLDSFDKVAGGITWCLTNINQTDLDFRLLLQEHGRMGDKIYLSENIERALTILKCPYPLQAQQIYYLDCIHIYPVIQWLFKLVMQVREQTEDKVRYYTESQFNKDYALPSDLLREQARDASLSYIRRARDQYAAKRQFRPGQGLKQNWRMRRRLVQTGLWSRADHVGDETEQIQGVLLQYGQGHLYKQRESRARDESGDEEQQRELDELEKRGEKLMQSMTRDSGDTAEISTDHVLEKNNALLSNLKEQSEEYERARGSGDTAEIEESGTGEKSHQRALLNIDKNVRALRGRLAKLTEEHDHVLGQVRTLREEHVTHETTAHNLEREIAELLALETDENRAELTALRSLVALNEQLKQQQTLFKQNCKDQREEWTAKIASLKKELELSAVVPEGEDSSAGSREAEIERAFDRDSNKLQQLIEHSALKSRQIQMAKRKIDEVPTRRELQQYQRQFIELYEQMALKYFETKQYYVSFNALEDVRMYIQRESSILNSMQEGYPSAMKSKTGKQKFLETLEGIKAQLEKSVEHVKNKVEQEKRRRDELDEQYKQLLDKERAYYRAAKEFQEECKKTELLNTKLSQLQKK